MAIILLAPDSFKGSATSLQVSTAIAHGWRSVRGADQIIEIAFGDGGEGTLESIERSVAQSERIAISAQGADGQIRQGWWLLINGDTAVIEMALICGITTISSLNPLGAHSYGLGEVISAAMAHPDVKEILIAVGGSASTDGGLGALSALGYQLLDSDGRDIGLGGGQLVSLHQILPPQEIALPIRGIKVLVDVQSPMVGHTGAAHVFGAQKGADGDQIDQLDLGLQRLLSVAGASDQPGFGAAGGTSGGLALFLGAEIVSGVETLAELSGLAQRVGAVDCIVTGEGSFDSQSFSGKVVGYLLEQARARAVTAMVVCGVNMNEPSPDCIALVELASTAQSAFDSPQQWLEIAGAKLATRFNELAGE